MRLNIVLFILAAFAHLTTSAQLTTTKLQDGREIIVNQDGTWKYADKQTIDSTKISRQNQDLKAQNPTERADSLLSLDSSDYHNWLLSTRDKVTGDIIISGKDKIIVSSDGLTTGFGITTGLTKSMSGDRKIVHVAIIVIGKEFGCIDSQNKINILFTDGTMLELTNDKSFNCQGIASLYFGGIFGKKPKLDMLCTKEIATMRIWSMNSYIQQDFDRIQARTLKCQLNCLRMFQE